MKQSEHLKAKAKQDPDAKPTKEYIIELARLQFDYVGLPMTTERFKEGGYKLAKHNSISRKQFDKYKSVVLFKLMKDFGYSAQKAAIEFEAFKTYYVMKVRK